MDVKNNQQAGKGDTATGTDIPVEVAPFMVPQTTRKVVNVTTEAARPIENGVKTPGNGVGL